MKLWPDAHDRLIATLSSTLGTHRFHHTLGVLQTALGLADAHGVTVAPVAWAALLHDICKPLPGDALRERSAALGESIPEEDSDFPGLWHARAAAAVARAEWGVEDDAILDAIRHHPTGHATMGPVTKVIVLADALEPTRGRPGAVARLALARRDLDAALIEVLRAKMDHLRQTNRPIHPRATAALAALTPMAQEV